MGVEHRAAARDALRRGRRTLEQLLHCARDMAGTTSPGTSANRRESSATLGQTVEDRGGGNDRPRLAPNLMPDDSSLLINDEHRRGRKLIAQEIVDAVQLRHCVISIGENGEGHVGAVAQSLHRFKRSDDDRDNFRASTLDLGVALLQLDELRIGASPTHTREEDNDDGAVRQLIH